MKNLLKISNFVDNTITDFDILYGSINFCLQNSKNKFPGILPNYEILEVSNYLSMIKNKDYLLNPNIIFCPLGILEDQMNYIFGDELYIRPNKSTKIFTGQVIKKEEIHIFKNTYHVPENELIVISTPKQINEIEFRFVVNDKGKIIGNCEYSWNKSLPLCNNNEINKFQDFIYNFISDNPNFFLDDFYVIDIALDDYNEMKIIEFNSFSSSSFYNMNSSSMNFMVKYIEKFYRRNHV